VHVGDDGRLHDHPADQPAGHRARAPAGAAHRLHVAHLPRAVGGGEVTHLQQGAERAAGAVGRLLVRHHPQLREHQAAQHQRRVSRSGQMVTHSFDTTTSFLLRPLANGFVYLDIFALEFIF
jgi:hypothetical protein